MMNLKILVFGLIISQYSIASKLQKGTTIIARNETAFLKDYVLVPKQHIGNLDFLEIIVLVNDEELVLELQLNYNIISKDFKQLHYKGGTNYIVNKPTMSELVYCQYKGRIKNNENSSAVISTCNRLNGYICVGTEDYYLHNFFMAFNAPQQDLNVSHSPTEEINSTPNMMGFGFHRSLMLTHLHIPINYKNILLYIELCLILFNDVHKRLGSIESATNYAATLTNFVNTFYSRVNISVVLVGVVIWEEITTPYSYFIIPSHIEQMLHFDSLNIISSEKKLYDFSKNRWDFADLCKKRRGGLISYEDYNSLNTAMQLGFNLGSQLGFKDSHGVCQCPDITCIMDYAFLDTNIHFSTCNIEEFQNKYQKGEYFCMRNKPVISTDFSICGNEIVEYGEECDLGFSKNVANYCCDVSTCTFKNNSQCSTGSCCDLKNCKFKDPATSCRTASNECDLPEYCSGNSNNCPEDTFKLNTEKCNDGKSYCQQGFCGNYSACTPGSECYKIDSNKVIEKDFCKSTINSFSNFSCDMSKVVGQVCSQPRTEIIVFDVKTVTINVSVFVSKKWTIVCTDTMIDDHYHIPRNASYSYLNETQYTAHNYWRKRIPICPVNCHNNGWCNNKGQCHCRDGYAPPNCSDFGFGGSLISNPSSKPDGSLRPSFITPTSFLIGLCLIGLIVIILIKSKKCCKFHRSPLENQFCLSNYAMGTSTISENLYEEIFQNDYAGPVATGSSNTPHIYIEVLPDPNEVPHYNVNGHLYSKVNKTLNQEQSEDVPNNNIYSAESVDKISHTNGVKDYFFLHHSTDDRNVNLDSKNVGTDNNVECFISETSQLYSLDNNVESHVSIEEFPANEEIISSEKTIPKLNKDLSDALVSNLKGIKTGDEDPQNTVSDIKNDCAINETLQVSTSNNDTNNEAVDGVPANNRTGDDQMGYVKVISGKRKTPRLKLNNLISDDSNMNSRETNKSDQNPENKVFDNNNDIKTSQASSTGNCINDQESDDAIPINNSIDVINQEFGNDEDEKEENDEMEYVKIISRNKKTLKQDDVLDNALVDTNNVISIDSKMSSSGMNINDRDAITEVPVINQMLSIDEEKENTNQIHINNIIDAASVSYSSKVPVNKNGDIIKKSSKAYLAEYKSYDQLPDLSVIYTKDNKNNVQDPYGAVSENEVNGVNNEA